MHKSSFCKMQDFVANYLADKKNQRLYILDIGSQDVNGSYKPLFENPLWKYHGLDTAAGKNVDIIVKDNYKWNEISDSSFDVVISGQAFEHIEYPWLTMQEISRVLKKDGLICIIAPSSGPEHKYPLDCWRIYPDGFKALAKWAKLEPLSVYTQWDDEGYDQDSAMWHDSVLIAKQSSKTSRVSNFLRKIIKK